MVLTPGPNMIYLVSRSICQGRVAGMISLGGIALGFLFYCRVGRARHNGAAACRAARL